jgi:ATP-binding cassette, subfamily B, bacterial MsbA
MGRHGRGMRGGGEKPPEGPPPLRITDRRMLAWFYSTLGPHAHKIGAGLAATLVSTLAALYTPIILRDVFDKVIRDGQLGVLPDLALKLTLLTIAGAVFQSVRMNVMHLLGQRFVYQLRDTCYRHLLGLDIAYFERERTGDIMSRVSNDVGAVEDMVVHGTDNLIADVVRIVGTIGFMIYLSWKLAAVALAPVPIFVISMVIFARFVRPLFAKIRQELGDINVKLQERLSGIYVIKAFAREKAEIEYFDETNTRYWQINARSIWMWTTYFPAVGMVTSLGLVVMIWYGASLAHGGSQFSSPGTVVAFLAYLQQFYGPINGLVNTYNTFNRALASMARIFELLDQKPDVAERADAVDLPTVEGRVEIEHVSFRYQTGEVVLSDVSVVAEPGETVAVVGRSGAGKTTLVNLIPRFYDPFEGRVLIDGHDVRDLSKASLRRHIGMVLQETFLFNASVKENILYARPDATEEEVIAAATAAHAHEFIAELEQGYETLVGERGVRLSGGQKQRLSIARALLADPRILILDEATSLVDTEAEQVIQQALANLMRGRTTFAIAHRLSTIRSASRIVVIDDGRVVEQDDHETLMSLGGLYAEMYNRQFQVEEDWGVPGPGLGGGMSPGGGPLGV